MKSGCPCFRVSVCHAFVRKIFSKSLNCMQPDLVWWCIIMIWSAMRKGRVPIFKVKVTVQAQILKKITFCRIFWTFEPFATKFSIVVHHHDLECCVTISDCYPLMIHHKEPECFMAIWDCCHQGQGDIGGWNLQGISSSSVTQQGVSCRTRR